MTCGVKIVGVLSCVLAVAFGKIQYIEKKSSGIDSPGGGDMVFGTSVGRDSSLCFSWTIEH